MMRIRHRHHPGDERGAVATEFVVVLPLFLVFVLGVISVGGAYFQQLAFTEAAREGARYGATLRTGAPDDSDTSGVPTQAWLQQVADVAADTVGDWEEICVTYTGRVGRSPTGTTGTWTMRREADGTQTFDSTRCVDDNRGDLERRVQVVVQGTSGFTAFFFNTTLTLNGVSVARFEPLYT